MNPKLTLITPMYNEASCIWENIEKIIQTLESFDESWEYILVDDGSKDDSYAIAKEALADRPNCRIVHYTPNRGRGYALRQGFKAADGEYIITTEADLTWGENIIGLLYNALIETGNDIVIASTYLSEKGYENVPLFRRKLSSYGNKILRYCFNTNLTMLSGMTRGYKADVIQSIFLEENRKEIHLEIISKAQSLGYQISEIPGKISWTEKRKSMGFQKHLGIVKHILPHILNSLAEAAFKIIMVASSLCFFFGLGLVLFGFLNKLLFITKVPKPNLVNYGIAAITLSVLSVFIAVLSLQITNLKRHIVHMQSQIKKMQSGG